MSYVEQLIPIGIIVILIGFALVVIGSILATSKSKDAKVEWAVGGFIGPIPFGFASRGDLLKIIIVISAIFLVAFLILSKRLFL